MKIVIATPILFDKTSPFNHLFKDILSGFVDAGHTITRIVATEDEGDCNYNLGMESQAIEYIIVKRKFAAHANIIKRYVMDTLTALKMARRIKKQKSADVLFEDVCYSSFWTIRAAKKTGLRVVAMLQDVWPDNAVMSGLISKDSFIYKYFEIWQKYVYMKADRIICISDDMKKFIESKGVDGSKIDVIYNWGYSDEIVDIPWEENEFVKKYDLQKDRFYAVYAGNIGRMQNVELVVEAARQLKDNDKIRFLIIGDGVKRDEIAKKIETYNLMNVRMIPMQPTELATSIYSAAGVNIIPLVAGGIKTALPSKTSVVLSCGRPVIFAFGEESMFSNYVIASNAGKCVEGNSSEKLSKGILEYYGYNDKNVGALQLFKELFSKEKSIKKYVNNVDIDA